MKWIELVLADLKNVYSIICAEDLEDLVMDYYDTHSPSQVVERRKVDAAYLDGGGAILTSVDYHNLDLDGYKFELKPEHLLKLHILLGNPHADEYQGTAVTWVRLWNATLVLPTEVYEKLLTALKDQQLHNEYKRINDILSKAFLTLQARPVQYDTLVGEA